MEYLLSFIACIFMALFAYFKNKLTKKATILSLIFGIMIIFAGGYRSFLLLMFLFLMVTISGSINRKKREEITEGIHEKSGKRDHIQVFSNLFIATLSLVLYSVTKNEILYITYACVIATSLADTLASDLGILSNETPRNIVNGKKSEKGLSGSITVLGLLCSLFGSMLIAFLFFLLNDMRSDVFYLVAAVGFFGSIIDSVYGSLQVEYRCVSCNIKTEQKNHCNEKTMYFKGIKFLSNDLVNLFTSIDIFIIAIIIQTLLKL